MSFGAFDIVIVVDWYNHEVAAVKSERCSLFWFCEDIGPIISVGQYIILRSLSAILSQIKLYLHLMCFVCLELEKEPLTSSRMVDWLSWKRMFCSTD